MDGFAMPTSRRMKSTFWRKRLRDADIGTSSAERKGRPLLASQTSFESTFDGGLLLRYRVPLLLIYACGLRVRECVNLSVDHIDGPGNRLFVRDGKGGKD